MSQRFGALHMIVSPDTAWIKLLLVPINYDPCLHIHHYDAFGSSHRPLMHVQAHMCLNIIDESVTLRWSAWKACPIWIPTSKVMWVLFSSLFMFSSFYRWIRFTQRNLRCISKSTMKHQFDWNLIFPDLVMVSESGCYSVRFSCSPASTD